MARHKPLDLFGTDALVGEEELAIRDTVRSQQVARDLVARVDETVHVATLDGTDVVYFVKADSSQAVRMVSAVGRRLPAHCTGSARPSFPALTMSGSSNGAPR